MFQTLGSSLETMTLRIDDDTMGYVTGEESDFDLKQIACLCPNVKDVAIEYLVTPFSRRAEFELYYSYGTQLERISFLDVPFHDEDLRNLAVNCLSVKVSFDSLRMPSREHCDPMHVMRHLGPLISDIKLGEDVLPTSDLATAAVTCCSMETLDIYCCSFRVRNHGFEKWPSGTTKPKTAFQTNCVP